MPGSHIDTQVEIFPSYVILHLPKLLVRVISLVDNTANPAFSLYIISSFYIVSYEFIFPLSDTVIIKIIITYHSYLLFISVCHVFVTITNKILNADFKS